MLFEVLESERGGGSSAIAEFFSGYPSLSTVALVVVEDCTRILLEASKANLRVRSSTLYFLFGSFPGDFSDRLPNNGLGSKYICIAGMPISTIHLCSDQLLDKFSDDGVQRCSLLLIALHEVIIFCQSIYCIVLYNALLRISSLMCPFLGCQIAVEELQTKTRRRKGL